MMKNVCNDCYWKDCCKMTMKACKKFQQIDLFWSESPNKRYRNTITRIHNKLAFIELTKANMEGDKR